MKLSVVVCTYNYGHLLPDTLRTLAAQSVPDFELVIVDDGSTDNTEDVAEQFRPQFRELRYLKKAHSGPADSRNTGARAARGTHIAFLDADDLWSPQYVSEIGHALSAHPEAELILCEGIIVRSENGIITEAASHRSIPKLCGYVHSPDEIFGIVQAFSPSGMVFSKDVYNRAGPFDVETFGWFSEDIDWMFRALSAGAFCVCLKQRLYLYRRHSDNLTNKASDSFRSWLALYSGTLKQSRKNPRIERLARSVIRSRALRFLPTCSTSEGRELLKRAIATLGGEPLIRLYYFGTYVGLVSLLKLHKRFRQLWRGAFRKKLAIDLGLSSESVFVAVNDQLPEVVDGRIASGRRPV
ncbi:MAG TPA: glycosyltransferase family A protein [Terriglobia bacterium]|nr:glycosyltransferase family A protein [Terriglobia bacterium]